MWNGGKLCSFALIHELDFDPYHTHKCPKLLDYIYTFPKSRRKSYAYKLLEQIKVNDEITTFCSNLHSAALFKKIGFMDIGCDSYGVYGTFRYPC